jgi:tRNA A37 threonylcarbamoyltransferase TsaD
MDIKFRGDVIAELLKSVPVQQDLRRRADRIAAAAGPGMQASVQVGRNRARGSVITVTQQARENEARNRALTRALDAGR